ncbi:hypothetical protein ATN79_26650 [Paraburkholderia caribensis]|nr:hypothetical protein ATN79_26650 [Paraburkholderia caribensis]
MLPIQSSEKPLARGMLDVLIRAGLIALAVLLIGIMQLPSTLVTIPVIIFVFATGGASAATIIFAADTFIAGLADNVLKPLRPGRGVDVPMPVVLIGEDQPAAGSRDGGRAFGASV